MADNIVHDLFKQLSNEHTHRGLTKPRALVAVLICVACSLLIAAVPAVTPATLWLPALRVSVCCAPQRLLPETPGDIASFASWSQHGPCLPWPGAAGRDVWVLRSHGLSSYIDENLSIIGVDPDSLFGPGRSSVSAW